MKPFIPAALAAFTLSLTATGMASADVVGRVDLSSQTMTVERDGRILYQWAVSTGKKGHRTPTGTWRPNRTHRMWRSRTYDNAPMPYSVFYYRGYAIHGTGAIGRLGRPASHGCVRLHPRNARAFYRLVNQYGIGNTRVVVER